LVLRGAGSMKRNEYKVIGLRSAFGTQVEDQDQAQDDGVKILVIISSDFVKIKKRTYISF
jgi:hypothetical protein